VSQYSKGQAPYLPPTSPATTATSEAKMLGRIVSSDTVSRGLSLARFHSLKVVSDDAESTCRPSGVIATALTPSLWPAAAQPAHSPYPPNKSYHLSSKVL
jgi:hypothetical protein